MATERTDESLLKYGDRVIATCGYILIMASIGAFAFIAYLKLMERSREAKTYATWLDLAQHESTTIVFIVIGVIAALLGKKLLTTVRLADARTIPYEDLPLIGQAVIDGKSEPIDQYVRIRSLSGWSGNFTKLGITGLPLTTVMLTLIFSFIALMPFELAKEFLDLAKLTLGAFIGSFVQRQVEQRRQESAAAPGAPPLRPSLPA